jgi:AraC-like DNA-binding protein
MRLSFDTSRIGPAERAGFWREVVCSVYVPMDAEPLQRREFHGRMDARAALGRIYSEVDAGPQRVGRNARQISSTGARDIFTFMIQHEGTCGVEQEGRNALLLPGDMVMFHNSRPYQLLFAQPFRQTVIQAPREALGRQASAIDRILGERIPSGSGFGRMLAGYARGFADGLNDLDDGEACVLVDELFCLLAAHGEAMQPPENADRGRRALALRAQRYARESIADPELNVESLARAQQVSARTLQRAFATQGAGIMRWLRDERLELCAAALASRAQRSRSVAEIAANLGFRDTTAFCRSFKARFGCTPGAWRAGRRLGN